MMIIVNKISNILGFPGAIGSNFRIRKQNTIARKNGEN